MIEDYDRPWKVYQRQAQKIATAVGENRLKMAERNINKSKLSGLEESLAKVEKEEAVVLAEIDGKIKDLTDDYYKKNSKYQNLKGDLAADLFKLEKSIEHESKDSRKLKAAYDEKTKRVAELAVIADEADKKLNLAKEMRADILSKSKDIVDRKEKLLKEVSLLRKTISDSELSLGNIIRNAPMIDFVAPTIKINQIILPHLKDDYFFNKVPRVDRCMSCHVSIDKAGFEDFPQPY